MDQKKGESKKEKRLNEEQKYKKENNKIIKPEIRRRIN